LSATTSATGTTDALDDLREREYDRLDRLGHVYLDYTGGGLYAESQLRRHLELLADSVFGNPHSSNPTSKATTELVEGARAAVLQYFHASAAEYEVVFTLNASGALKLVGEAFPFRRNGQYLLTFDNHNSVNGIREFARARGVEVHYAPIVDPDLAIDGEALMTLLESARPDRSNLFAYPAWHPDFVTLSFYKIFGYPTGVGCELHPPNMVHHDGIEWIESQSSAMAAEASRPWLAGWATHSIFPGTQ
jgi:molybdenum cofactor sulfurtransferase